MRKPSILPLQYSKASLERKLNDSRYDEKISIEFRLAFVPNPKVSITEFCFGYYLLEPANLLSWNCAFEFSVI